MCLVMNTRHGYVSIENFIMANRHEISAFLFAKGGGKFDIER